MIERISIILLVNLIFFLKTLWYGYCSDDIPAFRNPPKYKNNIHRIFLKIEGRLHQNAPEDHLITTWIHGMVCVFIYLAFGANDVSFWAAILFCFNPTNNQGSVWISGRPYVLPTLFILMSLTIPILSPVFLWTATVFNAGFLSPLALIGSDHKWLVLVYLVVMTHHVPRFYRNVKGKFDKESFDEDKKFSINKIVMAIKTFAFYTVHSLIPKKNTFYHSYMESAAGSRKHIVYRKDKYFYIGLALIAGILSYWIFHKWDTVSFCLLWYCIGIAPFCNLIRMSQEIAERYVYLPNVGLMVILASVLVNYPIALACFISAYATKLWFFMEAYRDDYFLVEVSTMNCPQSWFAWHIRAMKRWDTQSYREALILWVMAMHISPNEFKILFNIATCLKMVHNDKEAEEYLAKAAANIPAGQEKQIAELFDNLKKGKMAILL